MSLKPVVADLGEGQKITIQALIYTEPSGTCNCPADLLAPLVIANAPYPVGEPAPLPTKYIRSWKLVGPGTLSSTSGNSVEYKAPASIPSPQTATVVAQLNGDDNGKYMLLSTIKLSSESWIEMTLSGTAYKFPASPVTRSGEVYYLANPEDEGGGYVALKWTGGVGSRGFDLNGKNVWNFTAPLVAYASMYIPNAGEAMKPSGGGITITKLGDGWAEGTFNVSEAGFGNFLTKTTASGKFKAKLAN